MKHKIAWLMALCVSLVACVPTPSEPIVIGKDNAAMLEKAKATASAEPTTGLRERLGCPETYHAALTDPTGKVTLTGDIKITVPDSERMPLLFVSAARFSQDTVSDFFNALCGGETMYDLPTEEPKSSIEAAIRRLEDEIEALLEQGVPEDDLEIAWRRRDIADAWERWKAAPDEVPLVENKGILQQRNLTFMDKERGTEEILDAVSHPFSNGGSRFFVRNDAVYADNGTYTYTDENGNIHGFAPRSGSILRFTRDGGVALLSDSPGTALLDVTAESETGTAVVLPEITVPGWNEAETLLLSITPKDARESAEALLKQCGISDLAVDTVILYTNREKVYPEWQDAEEAYKRYTHERQAYTVRFLRQVNGAPVESTFGGSQVTSGDEETGGYGIEWAYEKLEIAVDDAGIVSLQWEGPLHVEEVVTDDAALLPFDRVTDILEKMLPIHYLTINEELTRTVYLTDARLCLWRVLDKDSYTRGILVPVWCFYGEIVSDGDALNANTVRDNDPLLIINAVDGSLIDPQQGY